MRFIGHAGLASGRPGGTPTRQTLADAERLHVDWIEVDVCRSSDGTLLLRHDLALPSGGRVGSSSAAEVRRQDPDVLTLDEGAEVLTHQARTQVLVDLKDPRDAAAVAAWLAGRADPERWALCTDDVAALQATRERAPQVARWRTLPRVPAGPGERVRRITACALRGTLPRRLQQLAAEVGAAAFTVDRWAVTPELCATAAQLGLPVAAWTVNTPSGARRMAACGVDLLTTDRVVAMRVALNLQDSPATARCDG